MIARIQNAVVQELNRCKALPRFIIIIPDWDILKSLDLNDWGVSLAIEKCMKWLVREVNRAVQTKKEDWCNVRKGAVTPGEPKIFYTEMLYKPQTDSAIANKKRFNIIMENCLCDYQNHFIARINVDPFLFDFTNHLTEEGQFRFRCNMDKAIKSFDRDKRDESMIP